MAEATHIETLHIRRVLGAGVRYACVLYANAWGWAIPREDLEEAEIEARLERAAYRELRRRQRASDGAAV